jgi:succinate dehydrogenase / fumarate reductase flavoprotein subunit
MGGLIVEADTGATTVPGLFGAGECAGGMNGANRLGGNSLSDLLVFGRRAGEHAAEHAVGAAPPVLHAEEAEGAAAEMTAFLDGPGEDPFELHAELQQTMQDRVGIFRDAKGLSTAIETLDVLESRATRARAPMGGAAWNPGWHLCRELHNMLIVAHAVTRAALLRGESRGAHSRLDFPASDFMVRVASLEMHPLDDLDRTQLLSGDGALGLCNVTKCCGEVCPQGIRITDNAIIPLKERALDRHDPLIRFVRRLTAR